MTQKAGVTGTLCIHPFILGYSACKLFKSFMTGVCIPVCVGEMDLRTTTRGALKRANNPFLQRLKMSLLSAQPGDYLSGASFGLWDAKEEFLALRDCSLFQSISQTTQSSFNQLGSSQSFTQCKAVLTAETFSSPVRSSLNFFLEPLSSSMLALFEPLSPAGSLSRFCVPFSGTGNRPPGLAETLGFVASLTAFSVVTSVGSFVLAALEAGVGQTVGLRPWGGVMVWAWADCK